MYAHLFSIAEAPRHTLSYCFLLSIDTLLLCHQVRVPLLEPNGHVIKTHLSLAPVSDRCKDLTCFLSDRHYKRENV